MIKKEKMPNRILNCENCGSTIVDNEEKHKYRDKYCPQCGAVYKRSGFLWRINVGFQKLKDWAKSTRAKEKENALRGRAIHNLRMEIQREEGAYREPTENEISARVDDYIREQKERKMAEQMRKKGVSM
jgi:transcription initiation factor TFIIIB Brf1 subunit/transcription initiation factor TFIIB